MTFSKRVQKNLVNNQINQAIDEFLNIIDECPDTEKDALSDANQLRSQIIVLAGRFNGLNEKINLGIANPESSNIEKTSIINSFVQILNQLPDSYPDLNKFINNRDEEDAWKEAQRINSIDGYDRYFKKYPNGKYIAETHRLMKDLNEIKRTQEEEMKRVAQEEKESRDRQFKSSTKKPIHDQDPGSENQVETENDNVKKEPIISDLRSNQLYFVEEYTKDNQEVGKSDKFFIDPNLGGYVTAMLRTVQPIGVGSVTVRLEREALTGSEITDTLPFDVSPDSDYFFFERITFYKSGDYTVTVFKNDGTVVSSAKVRIEVE